MMHGVPQKMDHLVNSKSGLSGPEEVHRGKGSSNVKATKTNIVMSFQGLSHNDGRSDQQNYPATESQFSHINNASNLVQVGLNYGGPSHLIPDRDALDPP